MILVTSGAAAINCVFVDLQIADRGSRIVVYKVFVSHEGLYRASTSTWHLCRSPSTWHPQVQTLLPKKYWVSTTIIIVAMAESPNKRCDTKHFLTGNS